MSKIVGFKWLVFIAMIIFLSSICFAVTAERVVSREHPSFNIFDARMTVGEDGIVYFNSGTFLKKLTLEGVPLSETNTVHYASSGIAVNKNGYIMQGQGHFAHTAAIFDSSYRLTNIITDFDNRNFNAPQAVAVGTSGDFYACDGYLYRVIRITQEGRVTNVYSIPPHQQEGWITDDIAVSEEGRFIAIAGYAHGIRIIDFDGTMRAQVENGNFTVDRFGRLFVIRGNNILCAYDNDGKEVGRLAIPRDNGTNFNSVSIYDDIAYLRRKDDKELYQRYSLETGEFLGAVYADVQTFKIDYANDFFTAGTKEPFKITFDSGIHKANPKWNVWIRPFTSMGYRKLEQNADGTISIPSDFGGVYFLKVTPELDPWQKGTESEYFISTVVEVRQPNAIGSVSIMTPENRGSYGRGEAIPVAVAVRTRETLPTSVTIELREGGASAVAGKVLTTFNVRINAGNTPFGNFIIPAALTNKLSTGSYQLTAKIDGYTVAAQYLEIGKGMSNDSFWKLVHGDMGHISKFEATPYNAPDLISANVNRFDRLGINAIVERLGSPLQHTLYSDHRYLNAMNDFAEKLSDDPIATSPEKVKTPMPLFQTLAEYSAKGIHLTSIFLMNDAGYPGGAGHEGRNLEELLADIPKYTEQLGKYTAFYGWNWANMWWYFTGGTKTFAENEAESKAYEDAVKQLKETGRWSTVLDKVLELQNRAATVPFKQFSDILKKIDPNLKTMLANPYRKVESYPPRLFQVVDEVDLHYQAEQVMAPYAPAHNVDFYKRPGKRAFAHPEAWNDDGTGGQLLTSNFLTIMRGADGAGLQFVPPSWAGAQQNAIVDPRMAYRGMVSTYRSLNEILTQYGSWITTTSTSDQIAIIGDTRMFRSDEWGSWMGMHFARVAEAYTVALHNRTPASIVFSEDMTVGSLNKYKVILIVGQRYQMDNTTLGFIQAAERAGSKVFYDADSRAEFLSNSFTKLDISFTNFEKDGDVNHDDGGYYRVPKYIRQNLPAFNAAIKQYVEPVMDIVGDVNYDGVYVTERISNDGKIVFVVNNQEFDELEQGQLWRVNLWSTTRKPVKIPMKLTERLNNGVIYDLFSLSEIEKDANGFIDVDLRSLGCRIFAVLPVAIDNIFVTAPKTVKAGDGFRFAALVRDSTNKAINTTIPLQVSLYAPSGKLVESKNVVAQSSNGFVDSSIMPANIGVGVAKLVISELFSGKSATLDIVITEAGELPKTEVNVTYPALNAQNANVLNSNVKTDLIAPINTYFGPRIRDIALSSDGNQIIVNTMNYDSNVYGVNIQNGQVAWQNRVGEYYAMAPQSISNGYVVQGFDYDDAGGYFLYKLNNNGEIQNRFGLYGLPTRLPHRFVPFITSNDPNNLAVNNFAASVDGSWIASAGDMGLVVFDQNGQILMRQDWWKVERKRGVLFALDNETLLVTEKNKILAYNPRNGQEKWQMAPGTDGIINKLKPSKSANLFAAISTLQGGQLYLIRDNALLMTIPLPGVNSCEFSPDSTMAAVTAEDTLNLYSLEEGLIWSFAGDGRLLDPKFDVASGRISVSSEFGSLYVLTVAGEKVLDRDNKAVSVTQWTSNGDLIVADWNGRISRLDHNYETIWLTNLVANDEGKMIVGKDAETVVSYKIDDWTNSEPEALAGGENLAARMEIVMKSSLWGENGFVHNYRILTDGDITPLDKPWLRWQTINWYAETSPINYIEFNSRVEAMNVNAITIYEDPGYPSSWIRDAVFDYWDDDAQVWIKATDIYSNSEIHTHKFEPVVSSRFRILLPWGVVGNLRMTEIIIHGESAGIAHKEVREGKPTATMYDENNPDVKESMENGHNQGFKTMSGPDAYSGANYFMITPWRTDGRETGAGPISQTNNWLFGITENPMAGQYRFIQFALRSLTDTPTTFTFSTGHRDISHVVTIENVPKEWTTYQVDLWELNNRFNGVYEMRMFYIGANGGALALDQFVLGRTLQDLLDLEPIKNE